MLQKCRKNENSRKTFTLNKPKNVLRKTTTNPDLWQCDSLLIITSEIWGQTLPIVYFVWHARRPKCFTQMGRSNQKPHRHRQAMKHENNLVCDGMKKESDFILRLIYFSIKQKIAWKSILTNGQVVWKKLQWIMNHMMLWVHYREGWKVFLRRMYIQRWPCQQKREKELHGLLPPLHHCFTAPRRC